MLVSIINIRIKAIYLNDLNSSNTSTEKEILN